MIELMYANGHVSEPIEGPQANYDSWSSETIPTDSRGFFASNSAWARDGKFVYTFGGYYSAKVMDGLYKTNFVTGEIIPLPKGPFARYGAAGAVVDGYFYICGGTLGGGGETAELHRYNIAAGVWEMRTPCPVAGREGTLAALGNFLYYWPCVSGSAYSKLLFRYDFQNDVWEQVLYSGDVAAVQDSFIFANNGYVYKTGGHTGAELVRFDPSNATWTKLATMATGYNNRRPWFVDENKLHFLYGNPPSIRYDLDTAETRLLAPPPAVMTSPSTFHAGQLYAMVSTLTAIRVYRPPA